MSAKRWLKTMGGLSLHRGGPDGEVLLGSSKSLALLAYVALAPGREASRRHLASLLWPGDPQRARRSLRQALYYLSQRAGTELFRSDDGTLRVAEDRLKVDAWVFDRALEDGDLERAVEVYGGPFLEGFGADAGREFESWAESRNERIWAGLKAACHELVTQALEAGETGRAVRFAREYVEVNPLDEKARRMLIRAHLGAGDRIRAYRAYEAYRSLLWEELDDEPGEVLRERMADLRDEIFGQATDPVPGGREGGGTLESPAGVAPEDSEPRGGRRDGSPAARPVGTGADPLAGWRVAVVAMIAGIGAAAGALTLRGGGADEGPAGWAGAKGTLRIAGGDQQGWLEARIRGGEVAGTERAEVWTLDDPTGRRTATTVRTSAGIDLVVLDRTTGDTLARTRKAADELPYDWSPDGRHVLFRAGEPADGPDGYRWRWEALDVETGRRRKLGVVSQGATFPRGDWSPRGSRIAVGARGAEGWDVWVVDADGGRPRRVTDHPADDRDPAWSPDGAWLVFGSDRGATRDLWMARPDGTGLERLTYGPEDEFAPAWLSDRHVAFAAGPTDPAVPGRGELVLMDVPTRRTRTLAAGVGVTWLHREMDESLARRRIETVRIEGTERVAAPGQEVRLEARTVDAGGEKVPRSTVPLRWSSSDTTVARVGGDGRLRTGNPGEAAVIASAGGWRADTVRAVVGEPAVRDAPVVFSEPWTDGLREDRWAVFGDPRPAVKRLRSPSNSAGPFGEAASPRAEERARDASTGPPALSSAFVSNGDENYDNGVVSRRRFDLTEGLTVTFQANLPFSGQRYESAMVGLVEALPSADRPRVTLGDGSLRDLAVVKLSRADADDRVWVRGAGESRLPMLDDPSAWHRYALQIEPDGTVSWIVDGRFRWRSSEPLLADRPDSAHVVLGGRSLHADLLVGPVTVRRGVRWTLEE